MAMTASQVSGENIVYDYHIATEEKIRSDPLLILHSRISFK